MRLQIVPPPVRPTEYAAPAGCPSPDCGGRHVQFRQAVPKPVRDLQLTAVIAHRYQCPRCGRTFRVYPVGISHDQTSARLKGLAVMFYVLGMSYGAVATALAALGCPLSKVAVYYAVQAAGAAVPGLRREAVRRGGGCVRALGVDLTSVRCNGQWLTVGVSVDAVSGVVLTIDVLPNAETETLTAWVGDLAAAVGAQVLVSDDADGFKTAADEHGLLHQVCKTHVVRNTERLVGELSEAVATDADGSLAALGVAAEEAVTDLQEVLRLVRERPAGRTGADQLKAIRLRYARARPPGAGERAALAYRVRALTLDRWSLWSRLTRYRTWEGPGGERLDGTNNGCERAIGWRVKERYRSMRGYKQEASMRHVSRLIAGWGTSAAAPGRPSPR
jgi:transposase-like protein